MHTNLACVLDVQSYLCSIFLRSHDAVFYNKFMNLFDARPNAIRTFVVCIEHFLSASNIDF